ncbi:motility associated factor glycosyltransferase family protein [Clostridium sp. BSD9I1]|uniref:motility associated factor glycosyltransferase family protein n=1 Tax=Clostridium sp. BSD9I1 TaxID=2003589 RepID=UPI0016444CB8|nr:6-hydroxymethylpterin diphosphokinase MptE-like protein [Clostridium sp. BSD9I1]
MNKITKQTIELINDVQLNEECNIEISKDNKYVMRIKKDDKLKYIGSKYSVERDIESFYKNIGEINSQTIFIIFGLGAGEHIKHLLSQLSEYNKVFIIEPSATIIKETIKISDYSFILQDNRVALCYFDDKIRKYLNDFIEDHMIDNIKIAVFSNYNVIFQNEYELFINEVKSVKKTKEMGNNTLNTFSHVLFNNFIENVFTLDEFYTVNYLKDIYKDKPAIIVSAGPSLTKNVHLLKEVQDKFIIICGPRTLGILLKNGINPDFLCEVDPQEEVYTFVRDYIDLKIPLVFMDSASNKVVKEHKGTKIIAANQGMEKHLEEMLGIKVDSLIQGGSVAHFCMGLAVYMGCNTVIFIGQDLAYTNEKFQAEGTYAGKIDEKKYSYENDKEKWSKDESYNVYVKDINGSSVRTSIVLNSYREEFEDIIQDCQAIKFINSTEGGAHIKGTEAMPLKYSIDLYAVEAFNKNSKEVLPKPIIIDKEQFIKRMLKIIDKLEIIKKACKEGFQYSEKMLCFYKYNKPCDINKVFSQLDRIDVIINNKEDLGFFAYKLVAAIESVMRNEDLKEKENETEKEMGIRLSKRSFEIYAVVSNVVEEFIETLKEKFIFVQCFQLQLKDNFY